MIGILTWYIKMKNLQIHIIFSLTVLHQQVMQGIHMAVN